MNFTLCNNSTCSQNTKCVRYMMKPYRVQEYQYRKPNVNIPHKFSCDHYVDLDKYKRYHNVIQPKYQY